jgi:hypothetical protein
LSSDQVSIDTNLGIPVCAFFVDASQQLLELAGLDVNETSSSESANPVNPLTRVGIGDPSGSIVAAAVNQAHGAVEVYQHCTCMSSIAFCK